MRRKSSTCAPWTKSLTNAITTIAFRDFDLIPTILFKFSLRVALPQQITHLVADPATKNVKIRYMTKVKETAMSVPLGMD